MSLTKMSSALQDLAELALGHFGRPRSSNMNERRPAAQHPSIRPGPGERPAKARASAAAAMCTPAQQLIDQLHPLAVAGEAPTTGAVLASAQGPAGCGGPRPAGRTPWISRSPSRGAGHAADTGASTTACPASRPAAAATASARPWP